MQETQTKYYTVQVRVYVEHTPIHTQYTPDLHMCMGVPTCVYGGQVATHHPTSLKEEPSLATQAARHDGESPLQPSVC